jgi:hypothetical protein
MKKTLFIALVVSSLPLYAQDDSEFLLDELNPAASELILEPAPTDDNPFTKSYEPEDMPMAVEPTPVVESEPIIENEVAPIAPPTLIPVKSESKIAVDDERFDSRKGHWVTTVGFERTAYEVPLNFVGARKRFGPKEQTLDGGRIGIGRESYLGAGFILGAKLEGYYMGTLFNSVKTADPVEPVDVAGNKETGQIHGADAIAHLGWMFDYKTKNPFLGDMTYMALELFVEAGIGRGRAINRNSYYFDAAPATSENYRVTFVDDFQTQIISAGMNFLSRTSGAFLYLRATQSLLDVTERKIKGVRQPDSQPSENLRRKVSNPEVDPITILAIGGGFKF